MGLEILIGICKFQDTKWIKKECVAFKVKLLFWSLNWHPNTHSIYQPLYYAMYACMSKLWFHAQQSLAIFW